MGFCVTLVNLPLDLLLWLGLMSHSLLHDAKFIYSFVSIFHFYPCSKSRGILLILDFPVYVGQLHFNLISSCPCHLYIKNHQILLSISTSQPVVHKSSFLYLGSLTSSVCSLPCLGDIIEPAPLVCWAGI